MKEFHISRIHGGENLHCIVVCKTKKRAMELLDVTTSFMNGYGNSIEPKTSEAIANPEKVYAYIDGGLVFRERPQYIRKVMPINEIKAIIDELRAAESKKFWDSLKKD